MTDGIFAIAMTLLVLDCKAPDLPKDATSAELLQAAWPADPAFFSFLVSFLYCGLMWLLHHLAFHFIRRLQAGLVWLNLLFLMSISILPFSCAISGHFIRNRRRKIFILGNMFLALPAACAPMVGCARQRSSSMTDDQARCPGDGQHVCCASMRRSVAGMLADPVSPDGRLLRHDSGFASRSGYGRDPPTQQGT